MEWFREIIVENKQFLISKNLEENEVCIETQDNIYGFLSFILHCESESDMNEVYASLDEEDIWAYYAQSKAQFN